MCGVFLKAMNSTACGYYSDDEKYRRGIHCTVRKRFLFTTFVIIFKSKFQFQIFYGMIFSFAFKYHIED